VAKDLPWLESNLEPIWTWGKRTAKTWSHIYNPFGPWTCLKLIALKFHSDLYTTIMNKQMGRLGFDSIVYVDVLAGSGLNQIRDTGSWVAGSSVVACLAPRKKKYDYILAIENDANYSSALAKRLGNLREPDTYDVVPYDATMHIDTIENLLQKRRAHYVAFVDYEGMSGFPWVNMEKLLGHRGDLFITFIPNIGRVWDRNWEKDRPAVAELVGEDVAYSVEDREGLFPAYLQKIKRSRPYTVDIKIRSGSGYQYMLIFAAGQTTKSKPKWFGAVETLKEKLESLDGDDVVQVLEYFEGRRPKLTNGRWRF